MITRAAIYANNIKIMETITDYTPKVNEFTDWTDAEIASNFYLIQNCLDSLKKVTITLTLRPRMPLVAIELELLHPSIGRLKTV